MMPIQPSFHNSTTVDWSVKDYALSIFALGYESRAVSLLPIIIEKTTRTVAFGFDHGNEIAYSKNKIQFEDMKVDIYDELSDQKFEERLSSVIDDLSRNALQNVFIDISCFTRFRLAAVVHQFVSRAKEFRAGIVVDFAYSLAQFEKPAEEKRPNTIVGPAHPAFAGWSQGGYSSTAAVLGLGYEQDQALGVVEFLQAGEVWAFAPNSPIGEYKTEVVSANELLLNELPAHHVLQYDVDTPKSIVATLESVVRGLSDSHSVVLVPFGPKIFVLCSLVVSAMRGDVAVWRVSQGRAITPKNKVPSGVSFGLTLSFPRVESQT